MKFRLRSLVGKQKPIENKRKRRKREKKYFYEDLIKCYSANKIPNNTVELTEFQSNQILLNFCT